MTGTQNHTDILIQKYGEETRWVNWRKEKDEKGNDTKVPYCSKINKASSTNSQTWRTYDACATALDNGSNDFSGVGIILHDSRLLCIDIDHVLEDRKVKSPQEDAIQSLLKISNTFTEISQSGTGLHLFFALTEPFTPLANKKAPFEIYSKGRFIATTGNSYHEIPLGVRTVDTEEMGTILKVTGYPFGRDEKAVGPERAVNQQVFTDEELLNKMFSSKNGGAIKSLFGGDISSYGNDDSSADMALCAHLAYWTGSNVMQMERIWLASPLGQRDKVQSRKDYRNRTISSSVKIYNKTHGQKVAEKETSAKNKKTRRASHVTETQIIETIYDPIHEQTQFAIYENNSVHYADFVKTNNDEFFPLDAKSDIVRKSIVLLPSLPSEYGTEAELLAEVKTFIHKYVDISPMFEQIASYYVLFSWVYDRFYETPYLRAIGDFGSGKSRFIQTIGSLCYKPIFTGGATTTAPIFRILDEVRGTLVLDEADLRASDMTNDIVKILNMGYQKGGSVLRMQGKELLETKAYDVFGPKIIATRETFADKALESRFLIEEMGRGTLRKDIPRNLRDEFYEEACKLRNKLLMWRFRNYHKDFSFDETPIEGIHPRLHQIIVPLLAIIESKEMKESLKDFMRNYNEELIADRGLSRESDIIFAIFKLEHDAGKKEVTVGEIAECVNWDVTEFDDKLTPRKIGWWLRAKLQLKPYKTRRGYVLKLNENRERLNFWKERFGITDADIRGEDTVADEDIAHVVNVENIVSNVESAEEVVNPEGFPF